MGVKLPKTLKIEPGSPFPLGVTILENGVQIAAVCKPEKSCGIVFYSEKHKELFRISFEEEYRTGNIGSVKLTGISFSNLFYQFFYAEELLNDPYAKEIETYARVIPEISWSKKINRRESLSMEDSIFYCLHVRGFTKDPSSKVKYPGTFLGLTEKINYLKELGVTTLELLPCYEFSEQEDKKDSEVFTIEQALASYHLPMNHPIYSKQEEFRKHYNYWGFKKGFYFSPKYSYSATKEPAKEFKQMVDLLHQEGFEVILQFFFEKDENQSFILDVLRHWVLTYEIDGFHLKGEKLPLLLISTDPLLSNVKLFYEYFPMDEIYGRRPAIFKKNLGLYHDQFMEVVRKFIRGDDEQTGIFSNLFIENPDYSGLMKYVSNYQGFTLHDAVTYQLKHNEENGEDNKDGSNFNYSCNYGEEGETKKRKINQLRKRQMMNMLLLVFLSQGTPVLLSGDEFGRTQKGNNNPYCQDNEISWIQWNLKQSNRELFQFVKWLIAFRRTYPIFRLSKRPRQMDYKAYGYPDISFHGQDAWILDDSPERKHIGVLFSNYYGNHDSEELFFYLAINMDSEEKTFHLPRLPKNFEYYELLRTDAYDKVPDISEASEPIVSKDYRLANRSIGLLIGRRSNVKGELC